MNSGAAVFTSSPQAVEVYQGGTWWRGELLGWRHDAAGTCQMWVRVVVGGVEETAWIDLAALRLPERHASPVAAPLRIDSRVTQGLPPAQAISAMRGRPLTIDAAMTAALPMIREEAPAPSAPGAAAGAPTVSVSLPGGRRRDSEGSDVQPAVAADVSVRSGRHRAPRDEGRHRAAETEMFAAIPDAGDGGSVEFATAGHSRRAPGPHGGAGWSVPQTRSARPEACAGHVDDEPDLLTRPMRLGELSGSSRRPRVGTTRFGA